MNFEAQPADRGKRLDVFVHERLAPHSRSRIQEWIKEGRVAVDGSTQKASYTLRGTECIDVNPSAPPALKATPEDLPLDILYEDSSVIAVNKPAGVVVHAGAGMNAGTLVNRLVYHFSKLSSLGGELRPGIVHRLDRYTSGVLLVARNDVAHHALARQFASRTVEKVYLALVHGAMGRDRGRITSRIARDPVRRTRMTTRLGEGRSALTDWEVVRRYKDFAYLSVRIGTGRTHQIRVHLSSIDHPVAGDRLYGAPLRIDGMPALGRYFLHAHRIRFVSPANDECITVEAPLPSELDAWLAMLTPQPGQQN
jgi:23S rRNA pseudouridine1911/1915/1917 synthase